MKLKAPPIQWLPVFEAAARLLSFKKAAEELCVTPPAVSQQIKVLEEYLGVALFDRSGRRLRLSQAGEFYYQTTSDIIKRHTKSYRDLERKYCNPILQISAPIFIAQELLIPNYMQFKEYAPNTELRITTGNEYVNFDDEPTDVALRFGKGNWPELECRFVSDVNVSLVCSQAYLDKHNFRVDDFLTQEVLENHALISLYENLQDWNSFYTNIDPKHKIICDSYFSSVRSAEEGLGIAIGLTPVINRTIRDGKLVVLNSEHISTDFAYWLVAPKNNTSPEHFDALYHWITALFSSLD